MKCMHLGEKTVYKPTQRDKPSNLGVKSRVQANSTRQDIQSWCVKTTIINSLQLVKMLQVSRKSVGFHHGALGNVIVLVHLIVQVVRQGAVIQISEIGQHFQVDCKKSKLFKNFPLVRSLDDDEASVSTGKVTKLAPDVEKQVLEGYRSGQVVFQAEPFIDVPVGSAIFGGREEVRVVHREANHFWNFAILRNDNNRQFDRDRLITMVKHIGMGEKG
ncbi:hypothetical protein TNCV_3697481 [Trichonephila clavipes]|uniref:Uncharacterized protein n=1 Tax=Trichonephila clavipes TaxID=2585209 RepID=A0A8X6SJX3_TRICX|nr:hypothetical protein TNCV_3697481 [Trichonephila clavipes]